ncbi:hypothetical protein KIF24_07205 [Micromonospora sp. Llam7]|uniref:DUF7718 family protein n=1 Tax=Micromonospora tarapacensis TaxID=2835305 RepID=UPI001C83110E|nr:hypothetical protein [Micromonospora tarapacensis]MBX7265838.1 hypothetical protein [Micromonospora tarapacensis]
MAKSKGRPQKGRLADMTIRPAGDDCYEPPPDEDCEEFPTVIDLAPNVRMGVRTTYLRGTSRMVYFAIWQAIKVDGKWENVARVDCHHGTIHRHDFTRQGDNHVVVLDVIPVAGGASEVLDSWCTQVELIMQNEWEDNLRRWRGDRE